MGLVFTAVLGYIFLEAAMVYVYVHVANGIRRYFYLEYVVAQFTIYMHLEVR